MSITNPFHSQGSIFTQSLSLATLGSTTQLLQDNEEEEQISVFNKPRWLANCKKLSCCSLECLQLVPQDILASFSDKIQVLTKQERDIFIKGILTACEVTSLSVNAKKRFKYSVYPLGKVCRDAMTTLLTISRQQFQNIINDLETFKSRHHGNKGKIFNHALTSQEKACIKEWLFNFAEVHGEQRPGRTCRYKQTRRTRDIVLLWLPSDFTVIKLHHIYLSSENAINTRFETFRRLYHDCDSIRVRSPRSDMCDTCAEFKMNLSIVETESSLLSTTKEFQDHLRQAKVARIDYNNCKTRIRTTTLSFDYSQNLCLPQLKDQPSELYFLSLLNISLLGIHNESIRKQVNYIYREDIGKKGSNNVASMLVDYIYRLPEQARRYLVLFADNCVGQNKNNTIIKLLCWLCISGVCESIQLTFMIKGNTKFSPYSCFGHIKKKFYTQDVYTVSQIKEVVESSSTSNSKCIEFLGKRFKEYRSKLDTFFNDVPGIAGYQSFSFKSNTPGKVVLKRLINDPSVLDTIIYLRKECQLSVEEYAFQPEVLEPPSLTERKKKDLGKVKKYMPENLRDTLLL
eukprot:NODE_139_length_17940_cov_0.254190.p2 type:complete len:571 gc:universal NODE_139_length_17940_cov_0.254190:8306-10018(+)